MGNEEEPIVTTQWKSEDVVVFPPLSANKFLKAIIDYKWGNGREEKLINEYNSAVLNLYTEEECEEKIEAYKAFLLERKTLKQQVDKDYWDNINDL